MKSLLTWLDHRTGIVGLVHEALYERIPGGARWRYVWGSTLALTFVIQCITGLALWAAYAPSVQTAWESVFYIQHQMQGGWFLRGLHHFSAQAMVVLLVLHLLQIVIDGAYRAPREVNFWIGLILMKLTLGLALTGYLLPWDQKGYWATRVATNLTGLVPWIGEPLQRLVMGGADYGHHTLTRFFALHAGLLPGLLIFFLVLHVALLRRHGLHAKKPLRQPEGMFWPDQILKDAVACLAVLAVIIFFVIWSGFQGNGFELHRAGAELTAPADASRPYDAARPEWYFLFLFQLLKYFPGRAEVVGAIVLPIVVGIFLFLMPLIGRHLWGHRLNVAALIGLLLVGVLPLTLLALYEDHFGPEAAKFHAAQSEAKAEAERAIELAREGIPPTGALALLRNDPLTHGRHLFAQHCAVCHGQPGPGVAAEGGDGAPQLVGFGSQKWLAGFFDPKRITTSDYFGRTQHRTGTMVDFVRDEFVKWPEPDRLAVIAALAAEADVPNEAVAVEAQLKRGRELLQNDETGCAQCHHFHDAGAADGRPDLTGYGSAEWLRAIIHDPTHLRFYPDDENDRMPRFGKDQLLAPAEIDAVVTYLLQTRSSSR